MISPRERIPCGREMECKETIPFLVREGRLETSFGDTFQKKTKTKTKTQKKYKHKERWSVRK